MIFTVLLVFLLFDHPFNLSSYIFINPLFQTNQYKENSYIVSFFAPGIFFIVCLLGPYVLNLPKPNDNISGEN